MPYKKKSNFGLFVVFESKYFEKFIKVTEFVIICFVLNKVFIDKK